MSKAEKEPVGGESLLEKAGKLFLLIIGVGVLIGLAYPALVRGTKWLEGQVDKLKKIISTD